MSFIAASRGEHIHSVPRGNQPGEPRGYRVVGWVMSDGKVVDVRMLDRDGTETTLADLEPRVRQGGRRLETVPFGVHEGCCDLNEVR